MNDQVQHIRKTERTWKLNPWASIAICCVFLVAGPLIGFSIHSGLKHKQFLILAEQVKEGCANPDNHFATVIIDLSEDMSWSCTPYGEPDFISRQHKRALKKRGG
jgi:hypothetical protein